MTELDNMILKLLRELRPSMETLNQRFDVTDKKIDSIKQAAFGESMLGRYAAAEVEERLEAIEKRSDKLERN